jgi:hypothetical protein
VDFKISGKADSLARAVHQDNCEQHRNIEKC